MLIDLYSKEKGSRRRNATTLAKQLAALEATARANDAILLLLHQVALRLIERGERWQGQITQLLKKQLGLADCRLVLIAKEDKELARAAKALPRRGQISDRPLFAGNKKAKSFFYLPVYKGKRLAAVLVFAAAKPNAFSPAADRDFIYRLGEMLAAAL